jgi:SAM-dependent methyltransferase
VSSGKVVGVDHSEIMLRQASRRNRAEIDAGRVQLHLASADALSPFTEPFDRVMASNVHMFLDDPVSTLRRWLIITRPGGWIAITHQSRKQAATDADTAQGAERIAADLRVAGFTDVRSDARDEAGQRGVRARAKADMSGEHHGSHCAAASGPASSSSDPVLAHRPPGFESRYGRQHAKGGVRNPARRERLS